MMAFKIYIFSHIPHKATEVSFVALLPERILV